VSGLVKDIRTIDRQIKDLKGAVDMVRMSIIRLPHSFDCKVCFVVFMKATSLARVIAYSQYSVMF
jgi:hypothetical protein